MKTLLTLILLLPISVFAQSYAPGDTVVYGWYCLDEWHDSTTCVVLDAWEGDGWCLTLQGEDGAVYKFLARKGMFHQVFEHRKLDGDFEIPDFKTAKTPTDTLYYAVGLFLLCHPEEADLVRKYVNWAYGDRCVVLPYSQAPESFQSGKMIYGFSWKQFTCGYEICYK